MNSLQPNETNKICKRTQSSIFKPNNAIRKVIAEKQSNITNCISDYKKF